jgi:hypothetical protein
MATAAATEVGANSSDALSAAGSNDNYTPADVEANNANGADAAGSVGAEVGNDSIEEIQEVQASGPSNKKPVEEVVLSSDSEDEEEPTTSTKQKQNELANDDDADDSLEIIKELPYSYMNRRRGPETAFLRSLLQQTNEEIKQGRKITDNTYQRVPESVTTAAMALTSTSTQVGGSKRNIEEVTLSSDEEDETDSGQNNSESAPITDETNGKPNEHDVKVRIN